MPLIQISEFKGRKQYHITIPIDIIRRMDWKEGQMLFFSLNNHNIVEIKQ